MLQEYIASRSIGLVGIVILLEYFEEDQPYLAESQFLVVIIHICKSCVSKFSLNRSRRTRVMLKHTHSI